MSFKKVGNFLLKLAAFFVILEPIWMLLPFAGFLYSSVLHIESLSNNPKTAWLVYFVFPTHSLFPLGIILILIGSICFVIGAYQIYSAKFLKKGLVQTGIYKYFRHPQYTFLTLASMGILLTWGRFMMFISFFIMLWLYYWLSRSEERQCLALFGKEYRDYQKHSYFLFPGEKLLKKLISFINLSKLPKWSVALSSFILTIALSIACGFLILNLRMNFRESLNAQTGELYSPIDSNKSLKFIMVNGPAFQAMPQTRKKEEFLTKYFDFIRNSKNIKNELRESCYDKNNTLLIFAIPDKNWHSGFGGDHENSELGFYAVLLQSPIEYNKTNFSEFQENWKILDLIVLKGLSLTKIMNKDYQSVFTDEILHPGNIYNERINERINFFLSGL